jgi:hypothetical protein
VLVTELFDLFRSDVGDDVTPNLWSDDEIYSYMDDAFKMFARLTGGIPDTSSDVCRVDISAGDEYSDVSPRILKFREAFLESTRRPLKIINNEDLQSMTREDYDRVIPFDVNRPGAVRCMVIGLERNGKAGRVRWVNLPEVADVALLSVYRLPLKTLVEGVNDEALYEINEEHHVNLLPWMRYRAYAKDDAETLDRGQSNANRAVFENYCEMAKSEAERYKSKTRVTRYGGI